MSEQQEKNIGLRKRNVSSRPLPIPGWDGDITSQPKVLQTVRVALDAGVRANPGDNVNFELGDGN